MNMIAANPTPPAPGPGADAGPIFAPGAQLAGAAAPFALWLGLDAEAGVPAPADAAAALPDGATAAAEGVAMAAPAAPAGAGLSGLPAAAEALETAETAEAAARVEQAEPGVMFALTALSSMVAPAAPWQLAAAPRSAGQPASSGQAGPVQPGAPAALPGALPATAAPAAAAPGQRAGDAIPAAPLQSGFGVALAASPSAPAQPGALALPAAAPDWQQPLREALGERLQVQLGRHAEQAVIRLDPPQLGRIEIAIKHAGGALEVTLTASHPEVRRQLSAISDTLRGDLAQRQFGEVTVNVAPAPRAGASQFADQHGRGRQGEPAHQEEAGPGRALGDAGHPASLFSLPARESIA